MGSSRWCVCVVLVACGPTSIDEPIEEPIEVGGESFDNPYDVTPTQLSQTDDLTVAPKLSVGCSDYTGTQDNSWYRMFSLSEMGVDRAFTVHRVNFGVQTAIGATRVKVSIGTYAGQYGSVELDAAKIDVLAMTTVQVPEDADGRLLQANFAAVAVPQASNLIVEIRSEAYTDGRFFYLGATQAAEMIPGYLRTPTCGLPNPLMLGPAGFGGSHVIIAVSGTY